MKLFTKIGIAALTGGIVLSSAGGIIYALNPNEFGFDLGDPISYTKTFNNDIDKIDLEIAFANVEIVAGDAFKLVAENVPENLDWEITESEDKLLIETQNNIKEFSTNGKFNISGDIAGKYTLYVPEKDFEKIIVEVAFSKVDISSLNAETMDIEGTFGEYNLTGIECEKLIVETAFSDASINNTVCEKTDITCGFGNLDSENLKITDSGDFENAFSSMNVKLDGNNYDFSKVESIGSTQTFNCPKEDVKIDISTSFGDTSFTN